MTEQKIESLVTDSLASNGFEDCFIYSINIAGNRLEVYLESDTGISYEICRKVSRHVEAYLDEVVWMDGQYTIEVSSPGVGSPLKYERQYIKNVGRTLEVKYSEGQKLKGLLTRASDGSIDLSYKERIADGKKKKTVETVVTIEIKEITEARVKVTF